MPVRPRAPRHGVNGRPGELAAAGTTFRRQKMTVGRRGHNSPNAMVKRRAGLVSRLLDSHTAKMTRPFKYDVAISATEFDALAAMELKRRLEHVLAKGVNAGAHSNATAPILAAAHKALEKD